MRHAGASASSSGSGTTGRSATQRQRQQAGQAGGQGGAAAAEAPAAGGARVRGRAGWESARSCRCSAIARWASSCSSGGSTSSSGSASGSSGSSTGSAGSRGGVASSLGSGSSTCSASRGSSAASGGVPLLGPRRRERAGAAGGGCGAPQVPGRAYRSAAELGWVLLCTPRAHAPAARRRRIPRSCFQRLLLAVVCIAGGAWAARRWTGGPLRRALVAACRPCARSTGTKR